MKSPLQPLGIEAGQPEALSSYVQRLAASIDTVPGQLLHRLLAHASANDPRFTGRWRKATAKLYFTRNINGHSHATAWLKALAKCVPDIDLAPLTTTPWDEHFPPQGLFSPKLRWCPLCLAQDSEPYHRLSWTLQPTTVCPVHHTRLQSQCPRCGRTPTTLHPRSQVLRCHHCDHSLISAKTIPPRVDPASPEFIASSQADAFIRQHLTHQAPLHPLCGQHLKDLCSGLGLPHLNALTKATETPKSTAWGWWHGNHAPPFPQGLRLARLLQFDLYAAMARDPSLAENPADQPQQLSFNLRESRQPTEHDWNAIRRRLRTESKRPIPQATRLSEIAREFHIDVRSLRRREPTLCGIIGSKSRQRRTYEAQNRQHQLKADISIAIQTCHHNGVPITQRTIADVLRRPGLFARPHARRAFAEVLIAGEHHWPKVVTFPSAIRAANPYR